MIAINTIPPKVEPTIKAVSARKKQTEIILNKESRNDLIFLPIVVSTLPKSYVPWWKYIILKPNLDRTKII